MRRKRSIIRIKGYTISSPSVVILMILSILVLSVLFVITETIRRQMLEYNQRIMRTYGKLLQLTISRSVETPELSILFDELILKSNFPLVYADANGQPIYWRNLSVPDNDTSAAAKKKVRKWIKRHSRRYPPIPVRIPETNKAIAYLYYGESPIVNWLRLTPWLVAAIIAFMFFVGAMIYGKIRRYEQQNIWLSLAKEAAHQLGTPTSSLLGWLQLMRDELEDGANPTELKKIVSEMERDITNLSRIVVRFGQIGSTPELVATDPVELIKDVVGYLKQRIPQLRKNIELIEHYDPVPNVNANKLLLSWALENLIKNSVEAIGPKGGTIWVATRRSLDGSEVHLIVSDTGKGIPASIQKEIFSPGFSTKKRGWGMGLSLARRIVEDYHHGRLFLLESKPYEKTTFIIALPVKKHRAKKKKVT
ncbi:HAMP domain-containing histidine kinase [bacterium]|nr:HAMP domain-containing histidine kinase [bacterium]